MISMAEYPGEEEGIYRCMGVKKIFARVIIGELI